MKRASPVIWDSVEPTVVGLGYDLVGVEYGTGPDGPTLRVYIDQDAGITLDDCVRVSDQLSAVLDVADPISEAYRLEISSPGSDRPLFRIGDYERFVGAEVRIRTLDKIDGRRRFKGQLLGVENGVIRVQVEDDQYEIEFEAVDEARLVPQD